MGTVGIFCLRQHSMGTGRNILSTDIYGDGSICVFVSIFYGDRSILWGAAMDAAGMNPRTLALFDTGPIRKCRLRGQVDSVQFMGTGRPFYGDRSCDRSIFCSDSARARSRPFFPFFFPFHESKAYGYRGTGRFCILRVFSCSTGTGRFNW
jgi:hypothetical protein